MILLVVVTVFGWLPAVLASPIEGDLFGYRLGSRYPVTDHTKGRFTFMGAAVLMAEKPEKSDDFQRVEISASPKTFRIANISGVAEFPDETQAKAFARQYADLLDTTHGNKCPSLKADLGESLMLICGGQYELTVSYYVPDKIDRKHMVHVGLRFASESMAGKQIEAQIRQEIEELIAEGKKPRFEKAKEGEKLRGLQ